MELIRSNVLVEYYAMHGSINNVNVIQKLRLDNVRNDTQFVCASVFFFVVSILWKIIVYIAILRMEKFLRSQIEMSVSIFLDIDKFCSQATLTYCVNLSFRLKPFKRIFGFIWQY